MIKIHLIQTGLTRIRASQRNRKLGGVLRVFVDRHWTEWLPIFAWVIEHPEGVIVVDTGETARTSEPGYLPAWHPYYRWAVGFDVKPAEEIGPQLRKLGISPEDVGTVIMTHLHTDHAGGLRHFPRSKIFVSAGEHQKARGLPGKLKGYLPHRWPEWFAPVPIPFTSAHFGSFAQSFPVTTAGDVVVVPTPGHTPDHVSVIVKTGGRDYFLAGDATYTEGQLLERRADGISPNAKVAVATIDRIRDYLSSTPTVYLPAHDPATAIRLRDAQVTQPQPDHARVSVRNPEQYETIFKNNPAHHTLTIRSRMRQFIEHLRGDVGKVTEPKAQALFETSAEVLTGLAN